MNGTQTFPCPPGVRTQANSCIERDHGARPAARDEYARIWQHEALEGAELFHGWYRTYEFARHFHSIPAIGVVEKGPMRCYCRGENHLLPAGTLLLWNPGEIHAPGPAHSGEWSFRIFFFENELFGSRSKNLAGRVLRFSKPFVEDRRLAQRLLRLHRKLGTRAGTLQIESSIYEILERLAGKQASSAMKYGGNSERIKVHKVKEYLNTYYGRDIKLNELAAVAQFSPYHLLRTFRNSVGLTPHAYLIQIRIEQGKRLLRTGTSISDASAITGFTDQSHFTRHFKRILGVTPGQYFPRLRNG